MGFLEFSKVREIRFGAWLSAFRLPGTMHRSGGRKTRVRHVGREPLMSRYSIMYSSNPCIRHAHRDEVVSILIITIIVFYTLMSHCRLML